MYRWALVSSVLLGLFMAGCGRPQTSSSALGASASAGTVTVKGSDTMVHLVAAWAEHYMKEKVGTEISVTGGGTGTGIAALINGSTDICAASREMSAAEKEQAQAKSGAPSETVVALDGIAVIVHPSNPVGELTLEQLKKIFTGAWTDWAETGSGSGKMIVLSRESSSGTYVFFQEHVLKKEDYTPKAKLMPATSAILQAVGEDRLAIGYVGLGYTAEAGGRVKVLNIKADDALPAVAPSEGTVRDGSYSISRPLYFYTGGQPAGPAGEFIQFCLGAAGQQIVLDNGYVPVK
jgi:phosphate transport system substrate-binding protein